jgi:hypothetical protein
MHAKFGHLPCQHPQAMSACWIMIVILLGLFSFVVFSLIGRIFS